jgi:hypothetical protein
MKKSRLLVLIIVLVLEFHFNFFAQAHVPAHSRSTWGLGLMIGDPSGVSARKWLSKERALDFGLAYSFNEYVVLMADYKWIFRDWIEDEFDTDHFHPTIGVGMSLSALDQSVTEEDSFYLGVRIPLGVEWVIPDTRVGVFIELTPLLQIVSSTEVDIMGTLGARYYF